MTIRYSTVYYSIARSLLRPTLTLSCLAQYRFKSNIPHKDVLLKSTTKSAQSLPPTKCIKRHEPKTLLEEMKSAEQSRRAKLSPNHTIPPWIKRVLTQKSKYDQWNPKRKLSRQEMIKVKELKETFPQYRTIDLAQFFHISPEAIRRILKSKWVPNDIDEEKITQRKERKLLQIQKRKQTANSSKVRDNKVHNGSKNFSSSEKSNDGDELNKHYNRIQSQF